MLVVFDIDGTLTRTYSLDEELFARTFYDLYGWKLDTDWTHYRHATDQGIAEEALSRCLGRTAVSAEIVPIRERYMALLSAELAHDSEALQVPGAGAAIRRTIAAGYSVAFATGCWEDSARLKLARASIDINGLPLTTCDDSIDRFEILRLATQRAKRLQPVKGAVYVGDGPWDLAASRNLGISFIGIACDQSARLATFGVKNVLPDFRDFDRFLVALREEVGA
jgi:phosphoglycolate phosphatase-like HAD superfamily hydrolase